MMRPKNQSAPSSFGEKPSATSPRFAARLERWLMAAQWHSKTVDLLTFLLEPLWAAEPAPARVVAVEQEAGATQLWLRPAQRWAWPKPGQFVSVNFHHESGQLQRCYSISGLDKAQDRIRLTVCAVDSGLVSSELAPTLKIGDMLRLSPAGGQFILPEQAAPLWLWAAGSGITPMLPLAEKALTEGQTVSLFYVCRGAEKALLSEEWAALQARFTELLHYELWDSAQRQRPTADEFYSRLSQQPANSHGFICGPDTFREMTLTAAKDCGFAAPQLHIESFYSTTAVVEPIAESADVVANVNLGDGREIAVRAGETILQAAKAAGILMPSCCGQGVCRSCETRKISGAVRNIQTGLKQLREGEWILPCISMPLTDVELAV